MLQKLKENVKKLKQETVPIYHALFDSRTPVMAKILAALTVAYLLSPIDLIPDFIPVLGLLDDLIIVPLLIKATLELIPKICTRRYQEQDRQQRKTANKMVLCPAYHFALWLSTLCLVQVCGAVV